MAIITYLDNGEITGVYTGPVDLRHLIQFIEVPDELGQKILQESVSYFVIDGVVVYRPPVPVVTPERFKESRLVGGLMLDGKCFAIFGTAMAYLSASLAIGKPQALVHLKDGDVVENVSKETAKAIIEGAFGKLKGALTALPK